MSELTFFLFTLVFGLMSGIIVWQQTEYVPPSQLEWTDAALHKGGVLLYAIVVGAVTIYQILLLHLLPWDVHQWLIVLGLTATKAFFARVLLFDSSLNLARNWYEHRYRRVAFAFSPWDIGTSAKSDRFVVAIAQKVHWEPKRVRKYCWWLSWALAMIFFYFY